LLTIAVSFLWCGWNRIDQVRKGGAEDSSPLRSVLIGKINIWFLAIFRDGFPDGGTFRISFGGVESGHGYITTAADEVVSRCLCRGPFVLIT
jgi:hypothetical protein